MKLPIDASVTWFTCSARLAAGDDPGVQAVGSLRPPIGAGQRFAGRCGAGRRGRPGYARFAVRGPELTAVRLGEFLYERLRTAALA